MSSRMRGHLRLAFFFPATLLFVLLAAGALQADDKDLLKRHTVPGNLLVVFGNSQTTQQPWSGTVSQWDGGGDSPNSKMGAAKKVMRQFVSEKANFFNIGLTTFAHNPNAGSIRLFRKHWLYAPIEVDYPHESWKEPIGTVERWGDLGEGPCTSLIASQCGSPSITLAGSASVTGPFFGARGTGTAIIQVSGSERVLITLYQGQYGDAYTDGSLSAYTLGTHSMVVKKVYQKKTGNTWNDDSLTPNGDPGTVYVKYAPASGLGTDLYFTTAPDAGKQIGFLSDQQADVDVNANCSGWQFQSNSAPVPLVKIPRDYGWGVSCNPPQTARPCINRLLRPQGTLVRYNPTTGAYTTEDHDNPGYAGAGSKYADGCDATVMGAVDTGLDVAENQAILITRNGSQAPIKNLLENILSYLDNPSVDGFQRGRRQDDPNAACRSTGVVLIYDNFNGCQNDSCSYLDNTVLKEFRRINVPVFVIGLGISATATSNTGICIAEKSGAVIPQTGEVGYFPVTSSDGLYKALNDIAAALSEATKVFATATVSAVQFGGDQLAYMATFNAVKRRAIWNGRVNAYKLSTDGNLPTSTKTIDAEDDPLNGTAVTVPSNDPAVLLWNAGMNLAQTPGTGATVASAVLAPGAALAHGTYLDTSTDTTTTIPTSFYPGRKIVFSLPQGATNPTNLPLANTAGVPEDRLDLRVSAAATWWPTLKSLLGPQASPPAVRSPALSDTDASETLRFVWGDRDAVLGTGLDADQYYFGLKLGDIFHSNPAIVGPPANFFYATADLHGYLAFQTKYGKRRKVMLTGANDGLLHAFDIGAWNRTPEHCALQADGTRASCWDRGTGVELFAYAPRAVMQILKPLKDAKDAQVKLDEWSVDGAPSAADVWIDPLHDGTPTASHREWRTVLIGGLREGSPFEGTTGTAPKSSYGTYYAIDITQPDELVTENGVAKAAPGSTTAPRCLEKSGDSSCSASWPSVLWEITDSGDADVSGSPGYGYPDMGETWSKPSVGRVRLCTALCGTASAVTEEKYVAIFGGGFDRERKNRRGNWLYMVDIETGNVLLKANSSCGENARTGCTPTYFGSIPAEPSALDVNGDGYLDVLYLGDQIGRIWRLDLTDLRRLTTPPTSRFANKIDFAGGSPAPFRLFSAPSATGFVYPIYYRPSAILLGTSANGWPVLGIAFGTGDRDDITGMIDSASLSYGQRLYLILDDRSNVSLTDSDLTAITLPTAPVLASPPQKGWSLYLANGERLIADPLTYQGYIYFATYVSTLTIDPTHGCSNLPLCTQTPGRSRFYVVEYTTGNPFPGRTDRGTTLTNASFASNPIFYIAGDRQGHIAYTSDYATFHLPPVRRGSQFGIKQWKER